MPINQLTHFCQSQITKDGKCKDCQYDCDNDCNICLQGSHFDSARKYDCDNMIYCYTCSYIYKYASEIGHLFKLFKFFKTQEFNILNLGCGSCADLFGIDNYLTQNDRTLPLSYTGIDSNRRWIPTQEKIKQIFPNFTINFILEDVFDFLDHITELEAKEYNFVILQYILNELIKNFKRRIPEFVELLVENLIDKMPDNSTIIINDINHNDIRSISYQILLKAQQNNFTEHHKKRFKNPLSHTYGGDKYPDDSILFKVPPDIYSNFDVKTPCSSAQLIIRKLKNK